MTIKNKKARLGKDGVTTTLWVDHYFEGVID